MLVMGIDTALAHCSAAIVRDGETLASVSQPMVRGHAEALAPMIADLLRAADIRTRDLHRVGATVGPGSFAGVRVGLSFARAMAIDTNIDVIGMTSLAALAASANLSSENCIGTTINARQGHLYAALFDHAGAVIMEPFIAPADKAHAELRDGVKERALTIVSDDDASIDPTVVARRAMLETEVGGAPPPPLYLRPPDAKAPAPGRYDHLGPQ